MEKHVCKDCKKPAELKIVIDSEGPFEKPLAITELASGTVTFLKLGITTNPCYQQ